MTKTFIVLPNLDLERASSAVWLIYGVHCLAQTPATDTLTHTMEEHKIQISKVKLDCFFFVYLVVCFIAKLDPIYRSTETLPPDNSETQMNKKHCKLAHPSQSQNCATFTSHIWSLLLIN